ncbi:MAG: thermonuclease family protein [Gemmobacter sp.]
MLRLCVLTTVVLWHWSASVGAQALPDIPSPHALYHAEVLRVIDGDTLDVRVDLWPGLAATYAVRVRGVDSPEVHGAKCAEERAWGEEAKALVEKLYAVGSLVRIENVERDPFFGRVVADVRRWRSDRWLYLADELVDRGLAEAWTPEMEDIDWCLLAKMR